MEQLLDYLGLSKIEILLKINVFWGPSGRISFEILSLELFTHSAPGRLVPSLSFMIVTEQSGYAFLAHNNGSNTATAHVERLEEREPASG